MPLILNGTNGLTYNDSTTQVGGIDLIDNTGAGADRSLAMGQTAYVGFSNATSVPLRIATGNNQVYEINLVNTSTSASNIISLLPNNTTGWTMQVFQQFVQSNSATSGTFLTETSGFRLSVGGVPLMSTTKVFTWTSRKAAIVVGRDTNALTGYGYYINIDSTDVTTPYTSLGTLSCSSALTGTVWIKRIG